MNKNDYKVELEAHLSILHSVTKHSEMFTGEDMSNDAFDEFCEANDPDKLTAQQKKLAEKAANMFFKIGAQFEKEFSIDSDELQAAYDLLIDWEDMEQTSWGCVWASLSVWFHRYFD